MRRKSELRGYQQRVVKYLYENDSALAVLKMGAGKTASTLTAIEELIGDGVIRHALVIAPKRVAHMVWPAEIEAWAHLSGLKYAVLDGPPIVRELKLVTAARRQITIIGIDNVQWLCDELALRPDDSPLFDCLVIDETSKLKDPKSKRAKALAKLSKRFRIKWGLTGTPRPNSLLDLYTPTRILTDGRLWGSSYYKWRSEHFYASDHQKRNWQVLPGYHEGELLNRVSGISIALAEGDMPDLPGLSILVDEVRLPVDARDAYDDMQRKLFAELDGRDILAKSAAVATGKLAQMANGFVYGEGGNQDVEPLHREKEEWISDLVESLAGEPLIIVYEYREDLAMLRRLWPTMPWLGAGVSDRAAMAAVGKWNRRELPILALHPASGGHGLNLQHGGSRMAWLSPTWSAEMWDQTIARIHRPGQAEHCMIHVCSAIDTVDELKRLRVISKLSAQTAFERFLASRARQAPRVAAE